MGVAGMWHGRGVVLAKSWQGVLSHRMCISMGPEIL